MFGLSAVLHSGKKFRRLSEGALVLRVPPDDVQYSLCQFRDPLLELIHRLLKAFDVRLGVVDELVQQICQRSACAEA